MLEQIERYIREHAGSWHLDVSPSTRLRGLLRANPENDGIVREFGAGRIGTIVFWFRVVDRKPFLVSKIFGTALSESAIAECASLQESANQVLGYRLFPKIHATAQINGARVVMMEAADGPTYEIHLARAVSGPERSVNALRRVVTRQFEELGSALRSLQAISLSRTDIKWGAMAASNARRFLQLCPAAGAIVSDASIRAMVELIDTMPLQTHFVLTEDHIANYLPGPRAVDQLVPDIRGLCAQWPGPVSGLRILLAFFRASPIREGFTDYAWLDALALCITGDSRFDIVGTPVRRFLDELGIKSASPQVTWAFVMGVFFMRACQELEFYADSDNAVLLRNEFPDLARDLIRIRDVLKTGAEGARRRLTLPRLHRRHLDGEFQNREHADFYSFPQLAVPVPRWLGAVARFQFQVKDRHQGLYRAIRWIYRLPLDLLEKLGRASRPEDAGRS